MRPSRHHAIRPADLHPVSPGQEYEQIIRPSAIRPSGQQGTWGQHAIRSSGQQAIRSSGHQASKSHAANRPSRQQAIKSSSHVKPAGHQVIRSSGQQ
eukprot:3103994-Prymnesium_polylepis.1